MRKFYRLNPLNIFANSFPDAGKPQIEGKSDLITASRKMTACLWTQCTDIKLDENGFSKEFKIGFTQDEYSAINIIEPFRMKLIKKYDKSIVYREYIILIGERYAK